MQEGWVTVTDLRKRIYAVLSEVAETGTPAEVTLKGRKFQITAVDRQPFFERLVRREILRVDPDDIVGPITDLPDPLEHEYLDGLS